MSKTRCNVPGSARASERPHRTAGGDDKQFFVSHRGVLRGRMPRTSDRILGLLKAYRDAGLGD